MLLHLYHVTLMVFFRILWLQVVERWYPYMKSMWLFRNRSGESGNCDMTSDLVCKVCNDGTNSKPSRGVLLPELKENLYFILNIFHFIFIRSMYQLSAPSDICIQLPPCKCNIV